MVTEAERERIERRETVENDRRVREQQGATLSGFATSEAATPLGRFTVNERSTVIGSASNPATAHPQGPAWSSADQGLEPPFPLDVGAVEPCGTRQEIQQSLEKLGETPVYLLPVSLKAAMCSAPGTEVIGSSYAGQSQPSPPTTPSDVDGNCGDPLDPSPG